MVSQSGYSLEKLEAHHSTMQTRCKTCLAYHSLHLAGFLTGISTTALSLSIMSGRTHWSLTSYDPCLGL